MPVSPLSIIRPLVGLGSAIAPRATGRVAFNAFCRTRGPAEIGEKERALIAKAEQRMAAAEVEDVPYPGGTVATYRFEPAQAGDAPTVVLIHGWTGRAAFMSAFVQPLLDAGFRVLAIDLPGHGRSSGRTLNLALAVTALGAVHARFGAWHGAIGHSFGGAIAAALAGGRIDGFTPVPLKRLVLIAAPESMPAIFRGFGAMVGLGPRAQAAFEGRVSEITGHPLETFTGAAHLGRGAVPTLVIHAPDDKEVAFANAAAFARAGAHVDVMEAPGVGHRRILHAPRVVAAAVAHMDAAPRRLPDPTG